MVSLVIKSIGVLIFSILSICVVLSMIYQNNKDIREIDNITEDIYKEKDIKVILKQYQPFDIIKDEEFLKMVNHGKSPCNYPEEFEIINYGINSVDDLF